MKRYPAYKNSGVEWIGEIPEHWTNSKIKYNTYVKGRIGWQGLTTSEYIDEGPFLVTGTDFKKGVVDWTTCHHVSEDRYDQDEYIQLQENDLLITKDGTIGKIALAKNLQAKATLNSGVFVTRPRNGTYTNDFMFCILNSKIFDEYIEFIKTGTTISHLYQNTFVEFAYPLPGADEQEQIANYLHHKTHLIDTLIEKKQKQIELLQEQRATIINQAVTKGLNPNIKMKGSGIEWLGEVPEHWQTTRLKFETSHIVDCLHSTPVYSESGGYPAIRTADVSPGVLNLADVRFVDEEEHKQRIGRLQPEAEDILYSREGERFGMAALVPHDVDLCLSQRMMMFRTGKNINPTFLMWQLNSRFVYYQASQDVIGATSPHVNVKTIRNFSLVMPPYKEQTEIAKKIHTECANIDVIIVSISRVISTLQEYRTTLISNVVTGKIDVRDEAIP